MSWFTKIFGEPDEWRMVKELESTYINTHHQLQGSAIVPVEQKVNINYYLYENQDGERKFDVADSLRGDNSVPKLDKNDIVFRLKIYRQTVKPWLDGRVDPDIPRYDKVKHHDMVRLLKDSK